MIIFEQVPTAPNQLYSPWRVDIQHAPKDELMLLEGIGTSLADRIIVYRETHLLKTPEDLLQVHGIGQIKVERCRRAIAFPEDAQ
ncbi:MAG: helix-hairpin-helix domain-containing protein [Planctomycetes bacterium]|nr:helix-hairpin-helix domain-containing protein [Planctomycetota bacterium]